jgi:uncharacterized phage infection (PIP) family protein YhgE
MNANELADKLQLDKARALLYADTVVEAATMLRQQQAEIDALKKYIAESNALDKKLHESIQKANEVWGKATKSILKKAKE